MKALATPLALQLSLSLAWSCPLDLRAADVRGYSVLKGQFLVQTEADELIPDPDFAFGALVSVGLITILPPLFPQSHATDT